MKAFWAYLQERFPPQTNGLLLLAFFSANYLLTRAATAPGQALRITWRFPLGFLALLLMFFHLRVIDEHKDYERDRVVHPDRLLSRGIVTLRQLRLAGLAAVTGELILSSLLGKPALALCALLLAIAWLIYKEFYLAELLDRHLLANAFLHLLVMPVYSWYIYALAAGGYPWEAPGVVLLYAFVSYGVGLGYELARKTRAPQDERPGLITYSRVMGPYAPALGMLLALLFSGGLSSLVGGLLHFNAWYHAAVAGLLLAVVAGVLDFRLHTSTAAAARLPLYAGVFIFAFDLLLAAELIRLHGLALA